MGHYNRMTEYRKALNQSRRLQGATRVSPPATGKLKILMLSPSPVAGVPYLLKNIINKYSEHECKTLTGHPGYGDGRKWTGMDASMANVQMARQIVRWADVIMLHNGARHPRTAHLAPSFKGKRLLAYYHSEPHRVDRRWEQAGVPAYVIAQGHSLLYPGMPVLPNLVDIDDPLMVPPYKGQRPEPCEKFTIAYAPSNKHSHKKLCASRLPYSSKGYPETRPVLDRLAKRGDITIKEFVGIPFDRCMKERRQCHIVLDEVVTGSYHRCTLEACSHGQLAINYVSEKVRSIVQSVSGCNTLPWLRCSVSSLYDTIVHLKENPCELADMMEDSRRWAEKYWDPKTLLTKFYLPAFKNAPVWS